MPDPRDVSVYTLTYKLVRALTDYPGDVKITTVFTNEGATFTVHVHPDDVGRLIGRHGHTAAAIRKMLFGIGRRRERKFSLVVEGEPTHPPTRPGIRTPL